MPWENGGTPKRALTDGIEGLPDRERGQILGPIYEMVGDVPLWIVDLLAILLILFVAWNLANLLMRVLARPVARRFERPSITQAVLQTIRLGVALVAILIVALIIGFQPAEIILSVTVFSAVLAVVLAPLVGRYVSGLFVLADRPFEIGDLVKFDEEEMRGYIEDVTLRYTKLFTLDNTFIVVPNSAMIERDVINYSAEDERTRQKIEVVVTYEGDLEEARHLLADAASGVDHVLTGGPPIRVGSALYPAEPVTQLVEFGDHGIRLALRYWVTEPYRLPTIRSRILERFWSSIADADVAIAYPHQHHIFDETSGQLQFDIDHEPERDTPT